MIEYWYRWLQKMCFFCIPLKKHNLNPCLEFNPDMCNTIKEYGKCNLGVMGVEVIIQHLHTFIIPQMIEKDVREEECIRCKH
jgi:hypothetical protein